MRSPLWVGRSTGLQRGSTEPLLGNLPQILQEVTADAATANCHAECNGVDLETIDIDNVKHVVDTGAKEIGEYYQVDGAAGGLTGMAEAAAANEIVDGHRHIE